MVILSLHESRNYSMPSVSLSTCTLLRLRDRLPQQAATRLDCNDETVMQRGLSAGHCCALPSLLYRAMAAVR